MKTIFVQTEDLKESKVFAVLKSQDEVDTMIQNIKRRCEVVRASCKFNPVEDMTIVSISSSDKRIDEIFYDPFEMERGVVYTNPHKPEILDYVKSSDEQTVFLVATRSMEDFYQITQSDPDKQDFHQEDFKDYEILRECDRELCNYLREKLNEEKILFSIRIIDYDWDLETCGYLVILYTDMYANYDHVYNTFKEFVEEYEMLKENPGSIISFNIFQEGFDKKRTSISKYKIRYSKKDIDEIFSKWIKLKFNYYIDTKRRSGNMDVPIFKNYRWSAGKGGESLLFLDITCGDSFSTNLTPYTEEIMTDFIILMNLYKLIRSVKPSILSIATSKMHNCPDFVMYVKGSDESPDVFYEKKDDMNEMQRYQDIIRMLSKYIRDAYVVPNHGLLALRHEYEDPFIVTIEHND